MPGSRLRFQNLSRKNSRIDIASGGVAASTNKKAEPEKNPVPHAVFPYEKKSEEKRFLVPTMSVMPPRALAFIAACIAIISGPCAGFCRRTRRARLFLGAGFCCRARRSVLYRRANCRARRSVLRCRTCRRTCRIVCGMNQSSRTQ